MAFRTTALAGLLVAGAAPALAQPMPPAAPASPASPAGPGGPGGPGGMMRDPFGDATVLRTDAEAQAAARFAQLDANADGSLSPEELAAARPAGANPPQGSRPDGAGRGAGRMARVFDTNGDGKITKDEFVAGSLRRFDMMDADHDGKLTKAERQDAFEQMRARIEAMRALGGGGDGPPQPGN